MDINGHQWMNCGAQKQSVNKIYKSENSSLTLSTLSKRKWKDVLKKSFFFLYLSVGGYKHTVVRGF